jgi:predicted metal-dependent hydrolase
MDDRNAGADDDIRVYVVRSRRKTVSAEIDKDLSVLVRAPLRMSEREIKEFLRKNEDWVRKHRDKRREQMEESKDIPKLTGQELRTLAEEARRDIPPRVQRYAAMMRVSYGRITIRNQKTRWGSCSSKGNLNFNCLLMLAPEEHRDYVIVHELCHRRQMNHSKRFWAEVERILPDYRQSVIWFKENGEKLLSRMM